MSEQIIKRGSETIEERYGFEENVEEENGGIVGDAHILYGDTSDFDLKKAAKNWATLKLRGSFLSDRFLKLEYKNIRTEHHFGEILMELSYENNVF